jgi:ketosteroid isomerase-like protein
MPQEKVQLVREAFELWKEEDYELLLEFFIERSTPDVELHSRFGALGGEPYRGHDGVRAWLAEIQESFESFLPWLEDAYDVGEDRVVALGGISFRARGSGVDMTVRMGWVQEFQDVMLRRMLFYESPAEALEAVGWGSGKAPSQGPPAASQGPPAPSQGPPAAGAPEPRRKALRKRKRPRFRGAVS